ncbi:putative N(4)-(beta-N-acetylglucosaminyl)-L-asparaginase [Acropora cervicornis]|uniref:N(4)-(Beta-N-acetylglucosaminyl)-L-asparaginase n=1 Tax=Acropora cervicornis TaxID=6130 RepID=A0AAD9UUG8_ACRCE|nr:putative N(4)-(beta-N-acetylglucosaminyl)-L-asparaginase [Acropora cervicornis]
MRQGKSPTEAASLALRKIAKYYPKYNGGLVVVNKQGEFGLVELQPMVGNSSSILFVIPALKE